MYNKIMNFFKRSHKSLGIEISSHYVRYAQVEENSKTLKLVNFGKKQIPKGVVVDGVVEDTENLASILNSILEKNKNLDIVFSLPQDIANFFILKIAPVSKKQLKQEIILRLKEKGHFSFGDSVYSYKIQESNKDYTVVRVIVMKALHVQGYTKVFSSLKKNNYQFELTHRAISSLMPVDEVYTLVMVGDDITSVSVVVDGVVRDYVRLPFSYQSFVQALTRSNQFSFKDVESSLKAFGLTHRDETSHYEENAYTLIRSLSETVRMFVDRWNESSTSFVDVVYVTGSLVSIPGVQDVFTKSMRVSTKLAPVWEDFLAESNGNIPQITKSEMLEFSVAIGLASEGLES